MVAARVDYPDRVVASLFAPARFALATQLDSIGVL